jgi:hypothetical protein
MLQYTRRDFNVNEILSTMAVMLFKKMTDVLLLLPRQNKKLFVACRA